MFIYREASKTVERVKTSGVWLGLEDDIKGELQDESLALQPNDTLLLYSDGITESWRRGSRGDELFGEKQLEMLFNVLGSQSLEQICNGILQALEDYERDDDVTLLILRRTA